MSELAEKEMSDVELAAHWKNIACQEREARRALEQVLAAHGIAIPGNGHGQAALP
jgi:hypothetical protein